MRSLKGLAVLGAMLSGSAVAASSAAASMRGLVDVMPRHDHHMGRTRYPKGWKRQTGYGFRPHNGEREIARRLRQAARNEERQRARVHARIEQSRGTWMPAPGTVGISRRGRFLKAAGDGR